MSFSHIQPISLRDQVVEQVRAAIIEGRLRPNDHVTEATLTSELGVSRTPVREALILLEREGLIVSTHNRGAFVRAFDSDDVVEIFSSRRVLEDFVAELVIDKLTEDDFDQLEALIARNRVAIDGNQQQTFRMVDMAFHRYFIVRSEHTWAIRSWNEIVAQIAALLHLRSEALTYFNEYRAISDHQAVIAAYRTGEVAAVQSVNRRVSIDVTEECVEAIKRLNQQK